MSIRIEDKDIVIEVDQTGIADSPHLGTANLRSVNLISVPGEVSVNFKSIAMNVPPTVSDLAFTVNTSTDIFTVASTTNWYNSMAITLNTIVTSTGISTGRVYWIGDLSGNTFKLYTHPSLDPMSLVDVTGSNGSGTLSTYTLSEIIDSTNDLSGDVRSNLIFFLDSTGKVWYVHNQLYSVTVLTNNLVYLGNTTLTSTNNRGINVFQSYLIVFRNNVVDAFRISRLTNAIADMTTAWTYGFVTGLDESTETVRASLVGQDDILYFANDEKIASISETTGDVFDPTDSASYTFNDEALDLNTDEVVVSIGELGTNLLIGTISNKIFPWDRVSPSFDIPIDLPEDRTSRIVTVNSVAYILAGFRGRIYETTGSVANLWKKIPDHLSEKYEPYYFWNDVEIAKGQLYVSFTSNENDGTVITTMGGVWAIDLNTKALRHVQQLSHGNGGSVGAIQRNILATIPAGVGLYMAWKNSAGTAFGVDTGSSLPYSAGETIIETEIIPIGTYTFSVTPSQYEFKLTRPLVSGESIELQVRTNLTESYTSVGVTSTAGAISDEFSATTGLENMQWVQMKAILTSTSTTPSRVPVRQFRISAP